MKLHQQFDLNLDVLGIENLKDIPKAINDVPILVERLIKGMLEKGYAVVKEGTYFMGIPQSITIIKDLKEPFVSSISSRIKNDFDAVSKALGIERLFE